MNFQNPDLKELASLIYETLKSSGINAVLVGGACVSIYSDNRYQSSDLDFATYGELKPIEKALSKLGFKRNGRQFSRPDPDTSPCHQPYHAPQKTVGGDEKYQGMLRGSEFPARLF